MPGVINPKPTKGTGILRFSKDIYLKFEYDLEAEDGPVIIGHFHIGEEDIELLPEEGPIG